MFSHFSRLVAISLFFCAQMSVAGVIERDWKTPGDGLLCFDDVNHREWLDLTVTQGLSFADVSSQLGAGEMFEGFTAASIIDLQGLVLSAGIDTSTMALDVNRRPTLSLIDLLGATTADPYGVIGVTSTQIGPTWNLIGIVHVIPNAAAGLDSVFTGADVSTAHSTEGVWLYRSAPEPSSSLLLGLGMAMVLGHIRRPMSNGLAAR